MVRVGGCVIICLVAAHAGIGDLGVVIAVMAGGAGNRGMSAGQDIIVIVYGECGRFPSWCRSVAISTGSRNCQCRMVRISRIVIISLVAAHTGIWRVDVIAVMTGNAGCRGMRPGQCKIIIVDCESCRFPAGVRSMAVGTGIRNILPHMVRVGRLGVVFLVA